MAVIIRKTDNDVRVTKRVNTVTVNKNTVASQFSSFTAAGDSGSSQITNGETLTVSGGTGIDTSGSENTISVAVDTSVIATKTYVDTQVSTVNTLEELTDTNITSPATDSLLQYNGSEWIDVTEISGGTFI